MTEPQDFYPWPRLTTMQHDYFLILIKDPFGRDHLQKILANDIKQFLRENPWYRKARPLRMPQVGFLHQSSSDHNAKEILTIYNFLLNHYHDPETGRNPIGIYYKAFRHALSQLRWNHQ